MPARSWKGGVCACAAMPVSGRFAKDRLSPCKRPYLGTQRPSFTMRKTAFWKTKDLTLLYAA